MSESRAATTATPTTATFLTILALGALSPGCGRDARGPILAGGREVKAWVADLRSPEPRVRRQAVLKLGNVGDEDPAAADALAGSLDDPDPLVRRDAILAVAKLKNPSAAIRGRLETLSRSDNDPRARELARKAAVRLGGVE
jgi:HEAT repeat protein